MIAGVTMEAMGVNVIFTSIIYIAAADFAYIAIGLVIHVINRGLTSYDHNVFRILMTYVQTTGRYRTAGYWGGASPTHMRVRRWHDLRDFNLE
jgi:type IV secretion system protein VirB3